jgi:hypothetical protein
MVSRDPANEKVDDRNRDEVVSHLSCHSYSNEIGAIKNVFGDIIACVMSLMTARD